MPSQAIKEGKGVWFPWTQAQESALQETECFLQPTELTLLKRPENPEQKTV